MPEIGVRNISVERALRWLQSFVEREWSLILPVGLAFFGLPRLILTMLMTRRLAMVPPTLAGIQAFGMNLPGWWKLLLAGVLLFSLAGGLTLMALALRPRISVAEAIGEAIRRLPIALAVGAIIAAVLFLLLVLVMTLVQMAGGGDVVTLAFVMLGMVAIGLVTLVLLPVVLVHHVGPVGALIDGWRIYSGGALRIIGGLALFGAGSWIVTLAAQVSIGSLFMIGGQSLGQKQLGDDLAALFVSLVAAIGWSGFYLLIAGFYRQRVGLD